jgi:uncharacterized protein
MMRGRFRSGFLLLVLLSLVAGACRRGEPEPPAEAAEPAEEVAWGPFGTIDEDSLYGATAVENLRFLPVELELRGVPRGWNGMRIAVLSDFLLGFWPDNARVAETAVRAAVQAEPDLIVLLGDYLGVGGNPAMLDAVLAPLQGRQVLAVLGDRDVRSEELAAAIVERMSARGIRVLRNEVVAFERGRDTAYIAGIDPGGALFLPAQQVQLFANLPVGGATPLLLSHLPEVLARLPERRFPAVLAGHTFCGDAEVPGSPRMTTLEEETLPDARVRRTTRLFRRSENTMFVTCGIGYSFVPARFAAPPEIPVVTLVRIPEPRTEGADTAPPPPPPPAQ